MSAVLRPLLLRKKKQAYPAFPQPLAKVRAMRQDENWPCITPSAFIEQRTARVQFLRTTKNFQLPVVAKGGFQKQRPSILLFLIPAIILAFVVFCCIEMFRD